MKSKWKNALLPICCCALWAIPAWTQKFPKADRDMVAGMLRDAASDVAKNYYDPKLHGLDWEAKVRQTKENIDKADTTDAAVSEVAALLDSLNDSHTFVSLPPRNYKHDYGFTPKMFGDHCYVDRVRAGSDAEAKGLKRGDEILAINDHAVSRKTLPRMQYIYNELRPQPGLRLTLRTEDTTSRRLDVMAKLTPSSVLKYSQPQGANAIAKDRDDWSASLEPRYLERGGDLLVVQLPQFLLSPEDVDRILGKMGKHKGVVLDLRGNPGGAAQTEDRLLGGMFEYDRKVYDRVTRKRLSPSR